MLIGLEHLFDLVMLRCLPLDFPSPDRRYKFYFLRCRNLVLLLDLFVFVY